MDKDDKKIKIEFPENIKSFWSTHKKEIKRTVKISGIVFIVGFVKGTLSTSRYYGSLIKKIPDAPAPDKGSLANYILASGVTKTELDGIVSELMDNDLIEK